MAELVAAKVAQQEQLGQAIQATLLRLRKDSYERKLQPAYLDKASSDLEASWKTFVDNNEWLAEKLDPEYPYVKNSYYISILDVRSRAIELIQLYREMKSTNVAPNSSGKSAATGETVNAPNSECVKAVRRQNALMEEVIQQLSDFVIMANEGQASEYSLQVLKEYVTRLTECDTAIWDCSDIESPHGYDGTKYRALKREILTCISQMQQQLNHLNGRNVPNSADTTMAVKLPKISLPSFDGDYLKWVQFKELYTQMIHEQGITKSQKMYYLLNNVSGEALRLIQHLPVSDRHYDDAWRLLNDRYNNKRILVNSLVQRLISQSNLQSECSKGLKYLHDTTNECLLGLKNLGVDVGSWDPILLFLLRKKLDRSSLLLYEQRDATPRELDTIQNFLAFLELRFQSLETIGSRQPNSKVSKPASMVTSAAGSSCIVCSQAHPLYTCETFQGQSPKLRLETVRKNKLCINCLKADHFANQCASGSCKRCGKRHHTLLHLDESQASKPKAASKPTPTTSLSSTVEGVGSSPGSNHSYILLGTICVLVKTLDGRELECRAVLDSGSQINIVTKRLMSKLRLITTSQELAIEGIGRGKQLANTKTVIEVKSRTTGYASTLEAYVLPHIISNQPSREVNIANWPIPQNIKLADPTFNKVGRIDLLIGAGNFFQLLSIGQIRLGEDLPTLQNTVFGWIVCGRIAEISNNAVTTAGVCGVCTNEEQRLEEHVHSFWEMDDFNPKSSMTSQEKKCEEHFARTTKRDADGRFIVRLPFSRDPAMLGETLETALGRFSSQERTFKRNNSLRQQYTEFMQEYLRLGHMREIDEAELQAPHYFLPHHSVMRPDSNTTKLRVVFDASAKSSTNVSLNQVLHTGPALQENVLTILLRFRTPKYVFTADIEKMYRQVKVDQRDQPYQTIVWRDSPDQPLRYFQLTTVTYGMTAAPYQAIKCLQSLAGEAQGSSPLGAEVLRRNIYVDDIMAGADSLRETEAMKAQLTAILRSGCFHLRKWCSNEPRLLRDIPTADRALQFQLQDQNSCHVKTLGLTWLPASDEFTINTIEVSKRAINKRTVSSEIAHIFDPLGILSPVTIRAKLFLQSLWDLHLDWDAAPPIEFHTRWCTFREEMKLLKSIRLPRHIFAGRSPQDLQMHVFCDASLQAYGVAIYVRSQQTDDSVVVRLLCARGKVVPSKKPIIARIELQAATLAAKFASRIRSDLNWQDVPCYFWCDSAVALAWLKSESSSWCTYVANRVATIQDLTSKDQWLYVPSKQNIADVISRGLSSAQLKQTSTWFYGPIFLHGRQDQWPKQPIKFETDLECKTRPAVLITTKNFSDAIDSIDHKNSFHHLQRIVAYVLRFTNSVCKINKPPSSIQLTVSELDAALHTILKHCQAQAFKEDLRQLKKEGQVDQQSHIASLTPRLDDYGVIRVGGRLEESHLSYEAKHPAILPYGHYITKLIMTQIHNENNHVAPLALHAITRQRFWPIKGKTIARSIVLNCVICRKAKPQLSSQIMGNLPASRVQPARPFITSGVDFCGPFWVHFKIRGKPPQKTYLAIFVCFATKAVHLELVGDLTTDAFIGALKRFIGRRGNCRTIYCDNATNFVGAYNQLRELNKVLYSGTATESIMRFCSSKGIDFNFIPPRSPHFGGLWEAAVKSAKQLLPTSFQKLSLTNEELATAVVEVEAILNSRPLTPLSSDPNDLNALTPGHFLIGEPLTSSADPIVPPKYPNLHQQWKRLLEIKGQFWHRWTNEYLSQLQHRSKWKNAKENLRVGTMVVLKEANTPVLHWPLGRIVSVVRGHDGRVRVVDVQTSSGVLHRAVNSLAPLPIETEEDEKQPISRQLHPAQQHLSQEHQHRRMPEDDDRTDQSGPSTSKRPRKTIAATMFNVLLVFFLTAYSTQASPLVTTRPLANHHGLYFEKIGEGHLSSNEWNLVIFFNLSTYWKEPSIITHGLTQLGRICDTIKTSRVCASTLSQLDEAFKSIQERNELLQDNHSPRSRRGAVDLIGNIAHSLFGVLDSAYAQEMDETIRDIGNNEHRLLALIRNQTSILDATTEVMQRSHEAIAIQIDDLNLNLNRTLETIARLTYNEQQIQAMDFFNMLATHMLVKMTAYEGTQTTLLDVVIDAHHGKINPKLLPPSRLLKQLTIMKDNLPATLKLPAKYRNLPKIYSLLTVEGRILPNKILFRLTLPLVSQESYEVLKLHSIPISTKEGFIEVIPTTNYLLVNLARDLFYLVASTEFSQCFMFEPAHYICKQTHPVLRKGPDVTNCEIAILTQSIPAAPCRVARTTAIPAWIQLQRPNYWIYVMNEPSDFHIVCGTIVQTIRLSGTGKLNVTNGCTIYNRAVILQASNFYSGVLDASFSISSNLSMNLAPISPETKFIPIERFINDTARNITHLRNRVQQLQHNESNILSHPANHIHHYSIAYINLAMVAALIFYLCRKGFQHRNQVPIKTLPIPAPRPTRQPSFSLDPGLQVEPQVQGGEYVQFRASKPDT